MSKIKMFKVSFGKLSNPWGSDKVTYCVAESYDEAADKALRRELESLEGKPPSVIDINGDLVPPRTGPITVKSVELVTDDLVY